MKKTAALRCHKAPSAVFLIDTDRLLLYFMHREPFLARAWPHIRGMNAFGHAANEWLQKNRGICMTTLLSSRPEKSVWMAMRAIGIFFLRIIGGQFCWQPWISEGARVIRKSQTERNQRPFAPGTVNVFQLEKAGDEYWVEVESIESKPRSFCFPVTREQYFLLGPGNTIPVTYQESLKDGHLEGYGTEM